MSEHTPNRPVPDGLPEAVVSTRRHISIVWLVPLIALLIGGWLAYKALTEKGPTITITFDTAEGLEAGKTKIRFKAVEMGVVQAIELNEDLSNVIVTAELVKDAEKYLTSETLFWVVRAHLAAGGEVSGLGTLFSGAYIGMDPGRAGASARAFKGLETPPVLTTHLPGRHFKLQAKKRGSIEVGSPVYYRQIKVGQVVAYQLAEDGNDLTVDVFIHAPHHERVRENTRFWNASGLDMKLDSSGIAVSTESLITILMGGIAFGTLPDSVPGEQAGEGTAFKLYETADSIHAKTYTEKTRFLLYFSDSVRGLAEDAPVEFRGIRMGKVLEIKLQLNVDTLTPLIPVLIEIEPERFELIGKSVMSQVKRLDKLVAKGLRAQLKTGSLLTGQLLVELDFHPNAPVAEIDYSGPYPSVPTVPSTLEMFTTRLDHLLSRFEQVPFEQIGKDLGDTINGMDKLVNSAALKEAVQALNETLEQTRQFTTLLNADVAPEVTATLTKARGTLAAAENILNADAPLYNDLMRVLRELAGAARSIRVMADYLERHPDALIYGKGGPK